MENILTVYLKDNREKDLRPNYCLLELKDEFVGFLLEAKMIQKTDSKNGEHFLLSIEDVLEILKTYDNCLSFGDREVSNVEQQIESVTTELLETKTIEEYSQIENNLKQLQFKLDEEKNFNNLLKMQQFLWAYSVLIVYENTLIVNGQWDEKKNRPVDQLNYELWYYVN